MGRRMTQGTEFRRSLASPQGAACHVQRLPREACVRKRSGIDAGREMMSTRRSLGVVTAAFALVLAGCPAGPEQGPEADRPPPVPAVNDDPFIVEAPDSPLIADTVPGEEGGF